jgi:hypothetical protein
MKVIGKEGCRTFEALLENSPAIKQAFCPKKKKKKKKNCPQAS